MISHSKLNLYGISHCYVWLPHGNGDIWRSQLGIGTRTWNSLSKPPCGVEDNSPAATWSRDVSGLFSFPTRYEWYKSNRYHVILWWLTVATVMLTPNCLEISEWLHNQRIPAPWWPVPGPKSGPVHPQYPPIAWTSIWTKLVAKIGTKTVLKHGVLEKKTFIDDCPIRTSVYRVFSCQCIFHCHVSALKGTVSFTG